MPPVCINDIIPIQDIYAISDYDPQWQLEEFELYWILGQCQKGLKTINGDASLVTITARQAALLLRAYVDQRRKNAK